MADLKKEMYDPPLHELGFFPDDAVQLEEDSSWNHYSLCSDQGSGYFRFYIDSNLFAISDFDFTLNEDLIQDFDQTDFLAVTWHDSVAGRILKPYQRKLEPCILGHLGSEDVFRTHIYKGVPYRGTGIMILAAYYRDYLKSTYPAEYENPREAFASINGISDFPELRLLLRQIRSCRSKGISAKLYFSSKIAECISLIVEKTKTLEQTPAISRQVCSQDKENLRSVVSYIETNLDKKVHLGELARIACMGTTKLKYTFKEVYKSTISDFILGKRLSRAEYLLSRTDLNINQISRSLGYKKSGSFSEIFRKNTGLLPNEYRKVSGVNQIVVKED